MSERPLREDGNMAVAMAAWMVLLERRGVLPRSEDLASLVRAVTDETSGAALVDALAARVAGEDPAQVAAWCTNELGESVVTDLGEGSREERTRRIRRFQFAQNTPWLARIYERHAGVVRPFWVVVERVTDQVLLMDPDPFDDIDEERIVPIGDFMVQWELDGCSSVAFDRTH